MKLPEIKLLNNLSSFLHFESALPLFITACPHNSLSLCTEGIPPLLGITVHKLLWLRYAHKETR